MRTSRRRDCHATGRLSSLACLWGRHAPTSTVSGRYEVGSPAAQGAVDRRSTARREAGVSWAVHGQPGGGRGSGGSESGVGGFGTSSPDVQVPGNVSGFVIRRWWRWLWGVTFLAMTLEELPFDRLVRGNDRACGRTHLASDVSMRPLSGRWRWLGILPVPLLEPAAPARGVMLRFPVRSGKSLPHPTVFVRLLHGHDRRAGRQVASNDG